MQKHAHAHTHKARMFLHSSGVTVNLLKYEMLSVTLLLTTKARGVSLESRVKVKRSDMYTYTLNHMTKST